MPISRRLYAKPPNRRPSPSPTLTRQRPGTFTRHSAASSPGSSASDAQCSSESRDDGTSMPECKVKTGFGIWFVSAYLFPSRIPAHRCAFKAHIDQQSASGSCTARHLTWARSRTSLRTTPRSRSEASTEKRNHNTKQELLRPLSLTLSFFRQGYGAGDCSPTRARPETLLPRGMRGC